MRTLRSFVDQPLAIGARFALSEAATAHLVRVLRLDVGSPCVLFNGDGFDYGARLVSVEKRGAQVEVLSKTVVGNESPLRITLAQGIARGDKMDWILQKATELGVARIAPVVTDRTEVKLDAERSEKKSAHWRGVLAAACEQSGRAVLPELPAPQPLVKFAAGDTNTHRLVLDPEAGQSLASLQIQPGDTITLVIGPEGGLSDRDLAALRAGGYAGIKLGPRILRTETAGIATLAALNALYGDWR
jgi:16S rRNA (uracil1498-N3)-methyltransferase